MPDWREPRWYETKPRDIKGKANKKKPFSDGEFEEYDISSNISEEEKANSFKLSGRYVLTEDSKILLFLATLILIGLLLISVGYFLESDINKNQITQNKKNNYISYIVRVLIYKNLPTGSAAVCEENNLLSNRMLYLETQDRNELIAIKTDFKISKCVPSDLPLIKLSETDFSKLYGQKQANLKEEKITIVKIIK